VTDIDWERQKLREQGLEIRTREEWDAVQDYSSHRECDVVADAFALHIAVVDDPSDLLGTEDQVARTIERIGQTRFGSGCSYNAIAFNTGRLYEGQPLTRRGAHTVNSFRRDRCPVHGGDMTGPITSSGYNLNVNWRALVLPQQVDDPVTDEQLDAAARWAAAQIRSGLARADARWHGHRCVTAKACPGQTAYDRIDELQALTDYYVKNGLDMNLSDQDVARIAKAILDAKIADDGRTVKKALRQASKAAGLEDRIAGRVTQLLLNEPGDIAATVTAEQIEAAVKQALREGTED
jgi:hypothetical protein